MAEDKLPPAGHAGRQVAFVLGLLVLAFLLLFPFCWLVFCSLKPRAQLFNVGVMPQALTLNHYYTLFARTEALRFLLNSALVAVVVTALTVCFSTLGAYSLVFFRYRGRELIGRLILFAYMFPGVIIIVPMYNVMTALHLTNHLASVMLVELVLTVPFSLWMLRGFFLDIPQELEEAAILDGCSKMQALRHVLLPLALPGIIAVAVFSFIFSWNEYLFPLVLINNEDAKTLPLGVAGFMGHLYVEWGPLLASAVVSTIPILILFTFLQRFLIKGLMSGAVKG
jgi:multiple sugar transport system permease protein